MRVLLTGSSGWLGGFLAPLLNEAGHAVVGLDVTPSANTQVVASVTDRAVVQDVMRHNGIDAVIHAGALHKPHIARHAPQSFVDVNVTGTLNLLEAATQLGVDRFVFTSTTSLMISEHALRHEDAAAIWLDEDSGPLAPRNIYGATKLAAEVLCRVQHVEHGLSCIVLRTARFFPEQDDTLTEPPGDNLKANEFLHRRLTAEDAAAAHLVALDRAKTLGFGTFIISAPTPFTRADIAILSQDAASVVSRCFPQASQLYATRGWQLPRSIDRVYDASRAERILGFRCKTDFAAILNALAGGERLPFAHAPT